MIGQYPVERELGRGGMGVVYLARDPRLNRHVAIKVLPAAFVSDPLRLQRFEREARTLAALNHRNIGMIFGLEEAAGQRLLVLEYIPGRTLTDMLIRPLPLDEVLRIAEQIAEGLEIAHERDVVHRDLKPDNVRVTPDGLVKLLDFGLATQQPGSENATGSQLTQEGMVMGTPGYMSPEQARGLPTDKRTDIWAFGCVLFEMLSGYKAFGGETISDCIAAILDREPDYALLPARTPNRLRELVRKLLVKDARRRLRDIGDARIELEDVLAQPQSGWYAAATSAGAGARSATIARLTMPLGGSDITLTNSTRGSIAVSPDGGAVVFVTGRAPATTLHIRRMDGAESRPIPGTAGADAPFFSPDGTKIGFFADGKLKRVALSGGAPTPMCAAPRPQGGCWDTSDTIYFIPDWQKGLMKIPGGGGTPELVADPDLAAGELAMLAPEMLPGGRYALVAAWSGAGAGYDDALITAIDLRPTTTGATAARRPLIHGGCNPRYLPSGHLVYSRAGSLLAVAFDPEKMEIFGQALPVEDKILGNALGGSAHFGVAGDGTLVYASGPVWEPKATLLVGGRTGEPTSLVHESRAFLAPAVSPQGKWMCVQVQGATDHLWLYDIERPASPGIRITFNADNASPVFTPDGKRIAFRSNMSGRHELYWMGVESAGGGSGGGGGPEPLIASDRAPSPCCFADGGATIIFTQQRGAPGSGAAGASALEIWSAPVHSPASAKPLIQSPTSAWGAAVSPDSKFIAYVSDETGRAEVYVQQYPGPGARRQVSTEGGTAPIWARAGGELFHRAGDQIIGVRIAVEPTFMVGRPRILFQGQAAPPTHLARNYDLLPSGDFVLLRVQEDAARVSTLNVTLNWFTELRRRVPVPQPPTIAGTRMGSSNFVSGGMSGIGTPMPTRAGPAHTPHAPHTPPPRPSFPSDAKTIG